MTTYVFVVSGTTTGAPPGDYVAAGSKWDVIAGGGGGNAGLTNTACGGGGGAWAEITGIAWTSAQTCAIAGSALGGQTADSLGAAGGDTWVRIDGGATAPATTAQGVLAKGATQGGAALPGIGGSSASSVGTTKNAGGDGGTTANSSWGGTAGGGAGGPGGVGGAGGNDPTIGSTSAGPGGGANGGGAAGTALAGAATTAGTKGGNSISTGNQTGTTGASGGTINNVGGTGSNGAGAGGGGGSTSATAAGAGGPGGPGTEYDSSHGSGGGGGGGGGSSSTGVPGIGGAGGLYGGGGGAGGVNATTFGKGGNGAPGILVIAYTPAGGANPFIAVDFPNPRGPLYQLDARSFINRTQTQLIGKDKFFGAAGQTETYDWPNPRGPAFPIDIRTFVNPTETQLIGKDRFFRGPGQSPVYDYPNPQPPRYPSDNRTFLNPTKTQLIGKDTFFRGPGQSPVYDWPNPVGRKALASDQPTSLLTTLLSVLLVAPFFQGDWPNPPRLRRPPMHEHSPNFLTALYTVLIPISAWFHNPWPALFPITARTHLNQTQTQLIGKDQFFAAPGQPPTYDWLNPIRPKQQMPETPPNLLATLLSILAFPFTQLSWPNPFARLFGDRTHLNAAQTQLIGQDQFFGAAGQPPVFDWSIPVNRKTAAPPEPTPNLLSTLLSILASPFAQLSWPNPAARRDRTTHLNAVQTQLIGQDQFFGAPGQVPTYPWNTLPVPRKDDVTQRSWLVNLLQSTLSLPVFAPFAFLGWTVPLGARPNQPAPQQPPNIVINTAPAPPSTDTPWSGFVANLGRMMIRRG